MMQVGQRRNRARQTLQRLYDALRKDCIKVVGLRMKSL